MRFAINNNEKATFLVPSFFDKNQKFINPNEERINSPDLQYSGINFALRSKMMSILEFTIVYLACGAPFGVYYFLLEKESTNNIKTGVKSVLITLFWFPFAIQLLTKLVTKKLIKDEFVEKNNADSVLFAKLEKIEYKFSQILLKGAANISIFEFRETFQRFVGLTIASSKENNNLKTETNELFQITDHQNPKLATTCLDRRNLNKLRAHQTNARKDFILLIQKINNCSKLEANFPSIVFELSALLNDEQLAAELKPIFNFGQQTIDFLNVNQMENEVWTPFLQKQKPIPNKTLNLQTVSTRTMMSKQD